MSTVIGLGASKTPEKKFPLTPEERLAVSRGLIAWIRTPVRVSDYAKAQWDAVNTSPAAEDAKEKLLALFGQPKGTNYALLWTQGKLSDAEFGAMFYPVSMAIEKYLEYANDKRLDPVIVKIFDAYYEKWQEVTGPLMASGYVEPSGIPYGLLMGGLAVLGVAGVVLWRASSGPVAGLGSHGGSIVAKDKRKSRGMHGLGGSPEKHARELRTDAAMAKVKAKDAEGELRKNNCVYALNELLAARGFAETASTHAYEAFEHTPVWPSSEAARVSESAKAVNDVKKKFVSKCLVQKF